MMRGLWNLLHKLAQAARGFLKINLKRKQLIISTISAIALIKIGLKILSFKSFQKLFKVLFLNTGKGYNGANAVHEIVWAINVTCKFLPVKLTCLERSLAAKILLRPDTGFKLHVGVQHGRESKLLAHAWLEKDQVVFDLSEGADEKKYKSIWVWTP